MNRTIPAVLLSILAAAIITGCKGSSEYTDPTPHTGHASKYNVTPVPPEDKANLPTYSAPRSTAPAAPAAPRPAKPTATEKPAPAKATDEAKED
jgi:Tfp pilus assembly protein PilP